jgi:glucose dehydrogenase
MSGPPAGAQKPAKTGKRRWRFQSVHHDIWDADNVRAPVLAELLIDGRKRKVVVYGSKACWYSILDRRSGEAVHGMQERPVPQHALQKTSLIEVSVNTSYATVLVARAARSSRSAALR